MPPSLTALSERIDALEGSVLACQSDQAACREARRDNADSLGRIERVLGCSPDDATGVHGRGMRAQVALLVRVHEDRVQTRKDRRRLFARIGAGIGILAAAGGVMTAAIKIAEALQ